MLVNYFSKKKDDDNKVELEQMKHLKRILIGQIFKKKITNLN